MGKDGVAMSACDGVAAQRGVDVDMAVSNDFRARIDHSVHDQIVSSGIHLHARAHRAYP